MDERRKEYSNLIEKIDNLTKEVDYIKSEIIGNGEPGINEKVRKLEEFVKEVKIFHNQIKRIVVGSAASIVVAIIIAAIIK